MEQKTDFANAVRKAMTEDLRLDVDVLREDEKGLRLLLRLPAKNAPGLGMWMQVGPKGDCKMYTYVAKKVPEHRRTEVLEALNEQMSRFRFVVLTLDEDRDVVAGYDFALFGDEETAREQARVMAPLVGKVVDECLPGVMRAVWSGQKRAVKTDEGEVLNLNLFGTEGEE